MQDDFSKRTMADWRRDIEILTDNQIGGLESRVGCFVIDVISQAEQSAPGGIADRLIEQIDEHPLRAMKGMPAHMTGGKDVRDIASERGYGSCQGVIDVWPDVREAFRGHLRSYFARLAAGEKGTSPRQRRCVREVNLARVIWFFLRAKDRAAQGADATPIAW